MFPDPHLPAGKNDSASADRALAAFVRARITEVGSHGCSAERKALAGILDILHEFEGQCDRVGDFGPADYYFVGQIDTLRWALVRVAWATFSAHPDLREILARSSQLRVAAAMEPATYQGPGPGTCYA